MNNNHPNFETLRVPQLKSIHRGLTNKREKLQMKMAADMGRSSCLDILPRNFNILPMGKCSLHDKTELEKLHAKCFDCLWTIEQKEAEAKNDLESFNARFQFWGLMDELNDNEQNMLFLQCQARNGGSLMSSLDIIEALKADPSFLDEVIL